MEPDNSQQMDHKRRYTCALASRHGEYSDEILLIVYKKEKSLVLKRDVGMAYQKVHKQGMIVNTQASSIPTSFHRSKDVGKELCIFTITFILPC